MAYLIALDAGGTKTETILFDENGHILLRDIAKGCNAMDLGVTETLSRLYDTLGRVSAQIPGGKPDYAFCGVASVNYYGETLTAPLTARFPGWPVTWEDDGWGMISSVIGSKDGCCIVCGTGCSLFARSQNTLRHIGGWGYLLDTIGSGYILGRDAIRASLRHADGRGEKTLLHDIVSRQMGKAPEDNIPGIYAGGRPYIASFARAVFEGRSMGDRVSRAIFDSNAEALAEFTWAAEPCFDGAFDVVMSGGIFLAYPAYAQAVIAKASPRAHMLRADVPPILGCALEAAWRADYPAREDFKARFMEEYRARCQTPGS